jgi:hypothetical protein
MLATIRCCVLALGTALLLAIPQAMAEDDPVAFAQSLYDLPALWSDVTADEEAMAMYLDEKLTALIVENYAKEAFESALDYDPLIQAQDFDEIKPTFKVVQQTAKQAAVLSSFENFGEPMEITLDLTKTADGWRLSDIIDREGGSLAAELKELNAASP